MRRFDDDLKLTFDQLADEFASLDEQPAQVAVFLADLRALGCDEPPAPSPDLEMLFAESELSHARRPRDARSRRCRMSFAVAAAAITTFGLIGVAAANDKLPQPAQGVVSRLVNDFTPFHIETARVPTPTSVDERSHVVPHPVGSVVPDERVQSDEPARGPAPAQAPKSGSGEAGGGATSGGSSADGPERSGDDENDPSTQSGGSGG